MSALKYGEKSGASNSSTEVENLILKEIHLDRLLVYWAVARVMPPLSYVPA